MQLSNRGEEITVLDTNGEPRILIVAEFSDEVGLPWRYGRALSHATLRRTRSEPSALSKQQGLRSRGCKVTR